MHKQRYRVRLAAILLGLASLAGCTHFFVDDCPSGVLGNNESGSARLRTSHYRVMLADPGAAAARFLPFAIMSTYAYIDGDQCGGVDDVPNKKGQRAELLAWLQETTDGASPWQLETAVGMRDPDVPTRIGCEDVSGLMFHVWHRKVDNRKQVVIAFRGTSGPGDWGQGNLWWFSRAVSDDTQFDRVRQHARAIMSHFDQQAVQAGEAPPRYVTTGHSLGGGLAQHLLYAFPQRVEQAIVFDSSSVTGFVDTSISNAERISACSCRPEVAPEARIIRVYQTYEILSNLRLPHKILFPPERHVQEVRFPFKASSNPVVRHRIAKLTGDMRTIAKGRTLDEVGSSWFASRDGSCTDRMKRAQEASCKIVVAPDSCRFCPQ